ncbi:glycosyltransferase [Clostridium sp. 001]|uniref:glycosyltransferase n=1 Tax=Clostridium sp. 001 TaxID=1970093 RepID=UPI001C2B7FEF|nr:glycosyltransferase [Clostridium sp. 001]QXE20237.1 hypothetical protein B5S50_16120 [Clostridium sp. 001]
MKDDIKIQIKENIQTLINAGDLKEAKLFVEQYRNIAKDGVEAYSMDAVILIMENRMDEAKIVLKEGLNIDENNFDLNYNLGYLYDQERNFKQALWYYNKALYNCNNEQATKEISEMIKKIQKENNIKEIENKKKIVFFVKQGMDSFLGDIIRGISDEYEIKKVIVTNLSQIDHGMEWADICWFEWCDELIGYGSKLPIAKEKKIICRLHRYEAFTNYIQNVNWNNVDKIIFVAKHIRDIVINKVKLPVNKCEVLYNGVNLNKFKYHEREKGFNLAWIGYLNLRKNPMLVIQYFNELVKMDKRYQLYLAGPFQDESLYYYINDIIKKLGIQNNIHFDGFIENNKMSNWLKNKNYLVTGSIAEGHPVGVMEAMASGLKPVIHYFPGAEDFYPKKYIYYDLNDFKKMVNENIYDSKEYRKFIEANYSLKKQITTIKNIVSEVGEGINTNIVLEDRLPLVSVCIPVYNGEKYIKYTIDSVINQTYKNLEIIICDNCSTDDTVKIVESYNDKRIKLYNNESNIGYTNNVNKCAELSNGKYIKYVYADDTIDKNCIQEMVTVMEKNPDVTLCGVNFCHINEKNEVISEPILHMNSEKYPSKVFFKALVINGNIVGCPSNVMIRKKSFKSIGLFSQEFKYVGDYNVWIKLCKLGNYYFINRKYMYIRTHGKSLTNQQISKIVRVREFYYLLDKYLDNINFTQVEIQQAYKNANNRCYYSLSINDNLNEKLEIIKCILNASKYIPKNEKVELMKLKNTISNQIMNDNAII